MFLAPGCWPDNDGRSHNLLTPRVSNGSTLSNLSIPPSLHPTLSTRLSNGSSNNGSFCVPSRRGKNDLFSSLRVKK